MSRGKQYAKGGKEYELICAKFCELVATGLSMVDSAKVCGVTDEYLRKWRENDAEFATRVFEARAQFKLVHIQNIAKAGKKWWAASAWLLERTFPEEYAQRSTVSLQGNVTDEMVKRLQAGRERAAALLLVPKKDSMNTGNSEGGAATA